MRTRSVVTNALMWTVLCQQRLASQFRPEDVSGLVLGDGMEPAYQMLTSNVSSQTVFISEMFPWQE